MDREKAIWLALGLGGGALLLIVGLPLIFVLTMGGGMMSGMMAPMFVLAAPFLLALCLIVLLPVIAIGAIINAATRQRKPAA